MACPVCGSYRGRVPLRWRVVACIFSAWDQFFGRCCTFYACFLRGCHSCCHALWRRWDDWYYRPPTVRKFYASQKRFRKRRFPILSDGHGIAMSDLLALDEPIKHQQEASSLQLAPQAIVSYLFC